MPTKKPAKHTNSLDELEPRRPASPPRGREGVRRRMEEKGHTFPPPAGKRAHVQANAQLKQVLARPAVVANQHNRSPKYIRRLAVHTRLSATERYIDRAEDPTDLVGSLWRRTR